MPTKNTKNDFQKQAEKIIKKSHNKKVYFAIAIIFTAIAIGLFIGIAVIINNYKCTQVYKNLLIDKKAEISEQQKNQNEQLVSDSSEILATDDWQIYRNEEFGFEVKYPEEWIRRINKTDNLMYFSNSRSIESGDYQVVVSIQIFDEKNIQEEIDKRKSEMKLIDKNVLIAESEVFVNNIKAKQLKLSYQSVSLSENLEVSTYLNYKNNLYAIHLSIFSITDKNIEQEIINVYNKILSAFKFID